MASSGSKSSINGNAACTALVNNLGASQNKDPRSSSTNVGIKTEPSSSTEQANTNESVTSGSTIKYEPPDTSSIDNLGTIEEDSITSLTNVRIKTEPLSSSTDRANCNESVTSESDIKPVIKTEPSDLHKNVTDSMLYPYTSGLSGAHLNPTPKIEPSNDYIPITSTSLKIEPNYDHIPVPRSYKWVSKDKAIPLKSKRRKKDKLKCAFQINLELREAMALRFTRNIMDLNQDKGWPNPCFDTYVFEEIKEHIHDRLNTMYPSSIFCTWGSAAKIVKKYGETYGMTYKDPILLNRVIENALKTYKAETTNFLMQKPQDLQFQLAVVKAEYKKKIVIE